ncbi:MAG: hypothetical protein AAF614_42565 [Chloroflexota bacterium]
MDFLYTVGFDVPAEQEHAFRSWVQQNLAAWSEAMPEGIKMVGIYSDIFSSEKGSGRYKIVLQLDSYGAMDKLGNQEVDETFTKLMNEFNGFHDVRIGAGESNSLMKSVADIVIWSTGGE